MIDLTYLSFSAYYPTYGNALGCHKLSANAVPIKLLCISSLFEADNSLTCSPVDHEGNNSHYTVACIGTQYDHTNSILKRH